MQRELADTSIREWFTQALASVDPAKAVEAAAVTLPALLAGPPPALLAIGKAAGAMTAGLLAGLPVGVAGGVVITKSRETVGPLPSSIAVFEAGHPIPDQRTIHATEAALRMLGHAGDDVPIIVLISGGGSALFEAPVEGVSLTDISELTARMLRAGATINELNAIRSRLSRVKQGGLLDSINDPQPTTLVLSDVIGNDLSVIASGPTVAPDTLLDPMVILDRLELRSTVAPPLISLISTPRPRRLRHAPGIVKIVADNDVAIEALSSAARRPAAATVAWRQRTGEARALATDWVAACRSAASEVDVLIGGGEATVTVRGDGIGGRNTEFAVAAALELDRLEMDDWVIASLATDGDDGPTGAAGGIVSLRTIRASRDAGIDPVAALDANDTRRVLEATGGLVVTGPTGTNVNDLYVAVRLR